MTARSQGGEQPPLAPSAAPSLSPLTIPEPRQLDGRRGRPRALERILVAAAMFATVWFYYWTVSSASGFDDWGHMDYYKLLVRGWRKGQLHLDKEPAPELLALADPYDPAQNGPYKLGDATLYRGKYYIYFGPAPALTLMLPYGLLTGREMTMGAATLVFCVVAFLSASGLWLAIRRRYFQSSNVVMAPLGVLVIGFGTHILALAQRPMFWELAIASGIAFSLLSVVAAYQAVHGRRPMLMMGAAGLCLGLAVASRPTALFAAPLLLVPIVAAWRQRQAAHPWWRLGFAAAVPLGLCGLAIMAHNYARFDNPFEWGQNYQLSGAYEGKLTHFSPRFFSHNFSVYFFQPLRWESEFPFALAQAIVIHHIPGYFGTEEVSGLMVTFPFFWFVLALPLAGWRRQGAETHQLFAGLACIAGYALPVGALVLCYFSTTMRYEADFAVALGVLAATGMLALERRVGAAATRSPADAAPRRRRVALVPALASLACAATVLIGVLVSFDYHGRSLSVTAPDRWKALTTATHDRLANIGRWLGQVDGPRVLKVRFRQQPTGTIEPFWQATDLRAAERIVIEHIGDHLIRFGFARGTAPLEWGRPLRWDDNHTHTVHVQLPSLYRKAGDGWWSGVRRVEEFRERTSVAVWFSGGRALDVVVEPLPDGFAPGGAVDPAFSGEIRRIMTRLFRDDELPTGLLDPEAPRGGVLRMRVVFPDRVRERGEPLFAAGAHYQSNMLFVQPAPGGLQFVYENYTFPRVESPVFRPDPRGHDVELEMASFRPDDFGREGVGDVVVRIDGREILRTRQEAYHFPSGAEQIGRNPFGTTCAPEFRGWIRDARWVRP